MWRMLWTTRSFIMLAMAVIGYYGYQQLDGTPGDDLPLRTDMASMVARHAALALPIPNGRPLLAIAPVSGDYQGVLTAQLRQWASRRNASIVELDWWETMLPDRIRHARYLSEEEAFRRAATRKVPYVVYAKVVEWITDPYDNRALTMEVKLIDTELSTIRYSNKFSFATEDASAAVTPAAAEAGPATRAAETAAAIAARSAPYRPTDKVLMFAAWLASGLMLPWLGSGVIGTVVRSDSNVASLVLVVGYLAFMAALAWYMWGRFEPGLITWSFIFLLSSVWLGYLEFVCRMLDNRPERL